MSILDSYEVILWDFDGVIMDSMPVRDRGFELVLAGYPGEQVKQLMDYHRSNGGLSRYHKFRYFFEQIRGESVTEGEISQLAGRFSEIMLENLLNPNLLIFDTFNFIQKNYQNYNMHVVSGSDQKELKIICEKLELSPFFNSIHGSPTPKVELVETLLINNQYDKSKVCLIGDSLNDYDAAIRNNIEFFGYNSSLLKSSHYRYIDTLSSTKIE